jgi:hypothetical protein
MKLPCHLESSEEGRDFYLKHRFEENGMKEFDLSGYDMEGQEMSKLTGGGAKTERDRWRV